jgi:hypothetical protein
MARNSKADAALSKGTSPDRTRMSLGDFVAAGLSLLWIVFAAIFFVTAPQDDAAIERFDSLRFMMTILAVFLPVALIWVAALAMRSSRIVREESRRLQAAVDAMRQTYVADRQAGGGTTLQPTVERRLNEIAQATQKTESALATFASSRDATPTRTTTEPKVTPSTDDQTTLALGTTTEDITPPLPTPDLIRALNFPDNAEDVEGFAALRRALKDRKASQLIQASQDVLTLLSQDGIYMDDLRPDRARPEVWRRFSRGERGRPVAALGGIRDRSSLALSSGRMREDTIFRDAAHHFLRRFDQMLVSFEEIASDEELAALSETRTARAFMLLGRVTGTFD